MEINEVNLKSTLNFSFNKDLSGLCQVPHRHEVLSSDNIFEMHVDWTSRMSVIFRNTHAYPKWTHSFNLMS